MVRPVPLLALSVGAGILGVHPIALAAGVIVLLLRDRRARIASLALVALGGLLGTCLAEREAALVRRTAVAATWMDGRQRSFEGIVVEAPTETRSGWRVLIHLDAPAHTRVHLHLTTACPPYRVGDRIRGRARFDGWRRATNPGEFDLRRHRLSRGIAGRGRVQAPPPIIGLGDDEVGILRNALGDLRVRIRRGVSGATDDPVARGLALALTLGERGALPDALREDFARAGMAHLLAISGLHLALGALLIHRLVRRLILPLSHRLSPRSLLVLPALSAVPLVLVQTGLAGAPPSCLRAAAMILYFSTARILGRRPDTATALGLAALINLVVQPGAIHEAGFQLSFGATGAILWTLSRRGNEMEEHPAWQRLFLNLLRVSLAAFLGTAPFVAWHFGALPLASPVANLLAVPVASTALLPCALLLGAWSAVMGSAPTLVVLPFELAAHVEEGIASGAASLGLDAPMILADLPWLIPVCLGLLLLLRDGRPGHGVRVLVCAGALGLGLTTMQAPGDAADLWLLDVGEGNLAVLRLPCGRVLLIDGGPPGSGRRILLPFLRRQGIRRVDDLVISHAHDDHYAGALEVYREIGAPRIITNGSPLIHDSLSGISHGSRVTACPNEASWSFCGVHLHLVSPGHGRDDLDENDRSLVINLTGRRATVLFTGDAVSPQSLGAAVDLLSPGRVSVLQIPHHGHRSPHLPPLLSALSPVISYSFSDGSPKLGGAPGVRRIIAAFSRIYHISGFYGPIHIEDSFRTLLVRGGLKDQPSY